MALTLGKSFNRQLKYRIPFKNYFYDIGIFYTSQINFNLFDIKQITKYGVSGANDIKINMFKNIEMSEFCGKCLDLGMENDRQSIFKNIKENWKDVINCEIMETITMGRDNYLTVYIFDMINFENEFKFILVERKHITKLLNDQPVTTLSGVQISTTQPISIIRKHRISE